MQNYKSKSIQQARQEAARTPARCVSPSLLLPVALCSLLFTLCSLAISIEPPQTTHLYSFPEDLRAPIRIAADAAGNIYITDTRNHRVCILDAFGDPLRYISGIQTPLGIAVDKQCRIYVGDRETGSVSIFTPEGASTGKLGTGDGQFTMPTDIAIDSQDRVYVVDSKENCVKVFDENRNYQFQFGDARLTFPTGIAIDELNNSILVGQYGGIENGRNAANVHIFDMQGKWKKRIGKYGAKLGEFTRIQGLAVDKKGRIYVTDCFQATVQVVDYDGRGLSFIGSYGIDPGHLRIPSDVAFDPYNRLWVTSTDNNRIEVFGIDEYASPDAQPPTQVQDGFTMNLAAGINFISVPRRPPERWTLSHLAAHIGDKLASIVTYDREKGYALLYIPGITDASVADMPVSGSESYIVTMREPKNVTFQGTAWEGEVNLYAGANFFAVPLQPHTEWWLSDLANHIGDGLIQFVIHDPTTNILQTYVPGEASSFNIALEGGIGYVAIMSRPKTVIFEGKAWENTPSNNPK